MGTLLRLNFSFVICSPAHFRKSTKMDKIEAAENEARMIRGELYHAFEPTITAKRNRCHHACHRFNQAGEASRRELVRLWRDVIDDKTPMPPPGATDAEEAFFIRRRCVHRRPYQS